jgi:hypothetical protein
MGWPAGHIVEHRTSFAVSFKTKGHEAYVPGFATRNAAEAFRWQESDARGLTQNRLRYKAGSPGVLEMQLHTRGVGWAGHLATFDLADLALVRNYCWYPSKKTGDTITRIKKKPLRLSRFLSPPPPGYRVIHLNGDRTDDRRCNHTFLASVALLR